MTIIKNLNVLPVSTLAKFNQTAELVWEPNLVSELGWLRARFDGHCGGPGRSMFPGNTRL
ncbi:MAG: hypothetical protein LBT47_10565 [Deltaproteobacteria bacterium]|nr:hypothetical protein [Deltaproteobacteria bacterium]